VAHIACIQVHEGRTRARIETHSTSLRAQTSGAQFIERHPGNVEVDGFPVHVLAELGYAARSPSQHRVG
jgi:hypothetical protein